MTACAYRSLEPVLRQRVSELWARRERDAVFVEVARRVASRRIGRAVGGAVGVAFGVATFLVGFAGFPSHKATATHLLFLGWPAALVVGLACRALAGPLLARRARVSLSGNLALDLRALEVDPLRAACERAMAWERASAALPLAAMSLLAPLTIHGLLWLALCAANARPDGAEDFGTWIGLSAIIVGHAHLALLVCAVRWARKLRTTETAHLRRGLGRAWGKALLVSMGIACLPGAVLLAIPPMLVGVTGLLFVPLMYACTARTLLHERIALEAT
jgi:hypothetical protein